MIEKINELRLGNYIEYNGSLGKIYSIEGPLPRKEERFSDKFIITIYYDGLLEAPYDEFNFVKITDELLHKFGFNKETCTLELKAPEDGEQLFFGKDLNGDIRIIQGEYYIGKPIKYLHELQNAYYDLTGEELWVVN